MAGIYLFEAPGKKPDHRVSHFGRRSMVANTLAEPVSLRVRPCDLAQRLLGWPTP